MIFLFQGCILRFHVNLLECNTWWKPREYIQLKTERPKVGENQNVLSRVHHQNIPALSLSKEDRVMMCHVSFYTCFTYLSIVLMLQFSRLYVLYQGILECSVVHRPSGVNINTVVTENQGTSQNYLPEPPHQKQKTTIILWIWDFGGVWQVQRIGKRWNLLKYCNLKPLQSSTAVEDDSTTLCLLKIG